MGTLWYQQYVLNERRILCPIDIRPRAGKQHYFLDDLGGQRSGPVLLFLYGASTVPTFSQKRSTETFITCCLKNAVIREGFIILAALALASV